MYRPVLQRTPGSLRERWAPCRDRRRERGGGRGESHPRPYKTPCRIAPHTISRSKRQHTRVELTSRVVREVSVHPKPQVSFAIKRSIMLWLPPQHKPSRILPSIPHQSFGPPTFVVAQDAGTISRIPHKHKTCHGYVHRHKGYSVSTASHTHTGFTTFGVL